MNKIYLIIIASLTFSIQVSGQIESYVFWNNDGYSSDWIKFFENGRFELHHDEQCYAYTTRTGVYKVSNDSIQIEYFKLMRSESELVKVENNDNKIDVTIYVYSLKDSSLINSASMFARDTTRQKFDLIEKVDSNGTKTFSLPKGRTVKYLRVYADNYVDCEIVFEENFLSDYTIKIYLSEDPLLKSDYNGESHNKEVMIRKGKNQIFYNGRMYKEVKK